MVSTYCSVGKHAHQFLNIARDYLSSNCPPFQLHPLWLDAILIFLANIVHVHRQIHKQFHLHFVVEILVPVNNSGLRR